MAACVSQQKYNSLAQARDNLELKATEYSISLSQERTKAINLSKKNQELNRQAAQIKLDNQRMSRELDRLRTDESELVYQHVQLTSKYEDMQDYFEMVLNDCDKDKIEIARKGRRLQVKEDSLLKVLIDLRLLEESIRQREQTLVVLTQYDSTSINNIYDNITNDLGNLISNEFRVTKTPHGVQISIDETVVFTRGSLDITRDGQEVLQHLAIALNAQPNIEVLVIGHTDKVKIAKKTRYLSDNWDLSVLKASAISRALEEAKLDPTIITASGRAAYDPMVSNNTQAGRDKNRRIEINIYPKLANQARVHMNRSD
ncbi:MAG: cell envelope biogenesis protein OmpA [Cyclobacteriaceae bacterium]|nr:MAG: cell envelope biogenesis protein OmpA [Cyclobacteriaceae bacterium]